MTTATMEFLMPDVNVQSTGLWGTIAAGIVAALTILYTLWGRIQKAGTESQTETEALVLTREAAERWKGLYDEAWKQVDKERVLRESAENRATTAVQEVEGLRSEVAALKRQIETLTAQINTMMGVRA